ncbi:MAG: NHLP bacteriocin system secretion protein [Deltaproteobacteria bacterium]|nr:NHLP bacteriocin system secretion protein [Deltaproteobacteria bacterium]
MDHAKRLFRKAALDKMASPERLDEMMVVTAPAGWWALGALGLILLSAVLWSIFGSIATKVHGNGLLIRGDAVLDVSLGSSGRLEEILVTPGDVVQGGQVLARVSQADLVLRIDNTRDELQTLMEQTEKQSLSTGRILAQLQGQRRELEEKAEVQESMLERGLVTKGTLLTTRAQLASVAQSIAEQQAQRSARSNRLDEVQRELGELENQLAGTAEVLSPYRGRVLELMVDPGNLVAPGMRLLTLEAMEGPIDAIVYIPAGEGKKVKPGMAVRISPSTVKREEYGFILGEVKKTSEYPVTPEGMARVLRNEQLVGSLTGETAPIEVVTTLFPDASTTSGFRWSSSEGPPHEVFTGTICEASVIVEEKRPISYVLPIFKEALGVS